MKPVPSTAEIIVFKMLGHNVNKKWIVWAYDMLVAGFESENLVTLAGEFEPYNQFELQRLTDKVFTELNLTYDNRELVYKNYVCYLVAKALDNEIKAANVLDIIKGICIEEEYEPLLMDFYMLYYAYDDLKYSENQSYWDGATRENIDKITKDYFMEWKAKCD
jgi:hypothetical protein